MFGCVHDTVKQDTYETEKKLLHEYELVGKTADDKYGWYKIVLGQPGEKIKKTVRIYVSDEQEPERLDYFCTMAVNTEPKWTHTAKIKTIYSFMTPPEKNYPKLRVIELKDCTHEAIYVQYPMQEEYYMINLTAKPEDDD